MDDSLLQFKDMFITESYEFLDDMENRLINLQPGCNDLEELNAIFRCAHSIKGSAAALGFEQVAKFTHNVETLLDIMREGKLTVTNNIIDVLLQSQDIKKQMIDKIKDNQEIPSDFGNDIQIKLNEILNKKEETTDVDNIKTDDINQLPDANIENLQSQYKIHFLPDNDILVNGNEPLLIIRELKKLGALETEINLSKLADFLEIDPKLCYTSWEFNLKTDKDINIIKEIFDFVEIKSKIEIELINNKPIEIAENEAVPISKTISENTNVAETTSKKASIASIRVDIDKVDRLVNMVGELIITQSMLFDQVKNLPFELHQGLTRGLKDLSHHSRELQEGIMAVRMQAVKSIFSRLPRLVRDLSAQLGKKIKLETIGEMTEVDKTVIEQLSDPLTHMIRNSVDHGIELPSIRAENGKEEEGNIILEASHRGGKIIIEISDDGGGINRSKVLSKAKSKNLIPEDANLTNEEIDQLIFLPGLSTAAKVTDVSGRGVGMDVVRRNILTLGGNINIENNEGKGTKFTLSLPLTLAILDGMVVKCGNESYIIPIANIFETLRPKKSEIKIISDNKKLIDIRGEFVPLIDLKNIFNIKSKNCDVENSLIILLENEKNKFGLIVDELIGQQQVVIKNIEDNLIPAEGISGATILGDGKVSFILDITKLEALYNKANCEENKLKMKTEAL